jgi:hypothetical protein
VSSWFVHSHTLVIYSFHRANYRLIIVHSISESTVWIFITKSFLLTKILNLIINSLAKKKTTTKFIDIRNKKNAQKIPAK